MFCFLILQYLGTVYKFSCKGVNLFSKMDSNTTGRLYHIMMLGLYASTITYNVLMVPMTKIEMAYGGRLKYLTSIDLVRTFQWQEFCVDFWPNCL